MVHYMIFNEALCESLSRKGYTKLAQDIMKTQNFPRFMTINDKICVIFDIPMKEYKGATSCCLDGKSMHYVIIDAEEDNEIYQMIQSTAINIPINYLTFPQEEEWNELCEKGFSNGQQVTCLLNGKFFYDDITTYTIDFPNPEIWKWESKFKTLVEITKDKALEMAKEFLRNKGVPEDIYNDLIFIQ